MTTSSLEPDEQLVDVLDDALSAIRSGQRVAADTWVKTHPELSGEGASLLEMLVILSQAADSWRCTTPESQPSRSEAPPIEAQRGLRMIGRYQIRRLVGSGTMGDVYEAFDPQLDRRVAVKLPRCERLSKDRELFTERFLREARAAAAVRHAHICPVYDAGEDNQQPYVVMAFVAGESLQTVLSRGRFSDVRWAVDLAVQVADALQAIHSQGIIHRDLKPGNILIDETGQALLTDFGLAVSSVDTERLTADGLIVGTPVYMSPEQAAGENSTLTPAADIYSFGAVFYEMLTGVVPIRAPLLELLRRIKEVPPASPREHRPELDPTLAAIPLKAMAKAPAERYSSAAELATTLRDWLSTPGNKEPTKTRTAQPAAASWLASRTTLLAIPLLLFAIAGLVFIAARPPRKPIDKTPAAVIASAISGPEATPNDDWNSAIKGSVPLTGDFSIIISSDPERGPVTKNRLRVEERGAYPLRNGELVQFEVTVSPPAYVYLLWVGPDGMVTPLYPWDAENEAGFHTQRTVGSERPVDHVLCPSTRKQGFEATDPVGLQTFVMLARRDPLPDVINLEQLLNQLPAGPKLDARAATQQPQLRGVKTGQTKSLDYALFDELESRLSPHFEFLRMMTFPQVSE